MKDTFGFAAPVPLFGREGRMIEQPRSIQLELNTLEKELVDAEWEQDYERIYGLVLAIDRLKFLLSVGERYDVAF